jgi:hypothetical protein
LEPDPVLAEHPEAIAEAAKRGIQINPYSYAGNNPINVYDPNGKSWVEIAAGVVITVGVLVAVLIIEPCIKKCRAKLEKDHAVCSGESEDNIQKVEALKKKALGQCIDLCVHLGGLAAGGAEPLGMAAEESGEAAGEAASGKEDNGHESQWEQQSAPVPGQ